MTVIGPTHSGPGAPWIVSVAGLKRKFPTREAAQFWIDACQLAGRVLEGYGEPLP
jgi:hypothetical protein